jgi:hypothetical protein
MPAKLTYLVAATTMSAVGLAFGVSLQRLPKCGSQKVNYTSFDESYESRILIESSTDSKGPPPSGDKVYAPQHTRWVTEASPDYMKPGPWTTRVYVGSGDQEAGLVLMAVDHASGGLNVRWLNEKLLYGQVWWGRIYSTDFILDVEARKFIYREMAHYGELIEPCQ